MRWEVENGVQDVVIHGTEGASFTVSLEAPREDITRPSPNIPRTHKMGEGLVDIRKEVAIGTECSPPTLNKGPYEFGWYSPASWAREVAQAS